MSANPAGGVSLGARRNDPIAPVCSSWECELQAALASPEVLSLVAFVGLFALLATVQFTAARQACEEERRRVHEEIDAFDEFADVLAAIEPSAAVGIRSLETADTVALAGGGRLTRDARLDRILEGYRETVMAVPHYEEDYGDTLTESIAAELGCETAIAVQRQEELSPALRGTLLRQAHAARAARSSYLDLVDAEIEALSSFSARGQTLEERRRNLSVHVDETAPHNRFDAAVDARARFHELETDCEEAVAERQRQIEHQRSPEVDRPQAIQELLYSGLPETNYPVLSWFADLAHRVRDDRRRMERMAARFG